MIDEAWSKSRPTITDRFFWEPLPDGCLLFEEATGELITLNGPAELILSHCDGEHSIGDLQRMVEAELEVSPSVTEELIRRLLSAGVIANEAVE